MSYNTPYGRLTGTMTIYVAPLTAGVAEAKPAINADPAGNWTVLGETDGDQEFENVGALTFFRDNDHTGPRKAVRPEEDYIFRAMLVNLTLEQRAYVNSMLQSLVVTDAAPPAIKTLPHKRGFYPTPYSLLVKGTYDSPYGQFPGQHYIPMGYFDGEPTETRAKDGSPGLEFEFTAIEDTAQASGMEFGWMEAQTA